MGRRATSVHNAFQPRSCSNPGFRYRALWMQKLLIKDFSLQTYSQFRLPVSERQADLPGMADKVLQGFSYVLHVEDVRLASARGLYDYQLNFRMFGGSVEGLFTSKVVTTTFRAG